jgi:hypothetical protein
LAVPQPLEGGADGLFGLGEGHVSLPWFVCSWVLIG